MSEKLFRRQAEAHMVDAQKRAARAWGLVDVALVRLDIPGEEDDAYQKLERAKEHLENASSWLRMAQERIERLAEAREETKGTRVNGSNDEQAEDRSD